MKAEEKVEEIVSTINRVVEEIVDSFNDIAAFARENIDNLPYDIYRSLEDRLTIKKNYLLQEIPYVLARHMARIAGLQYVDPEDTIMLNFGEFKCIDSDTCIAVFVDGNKAYVIDWDLLEKNKATYNVYSIVKPDE